MKTRAPRGNVLLVAVVSVVVLTVLVVGAIQFTGQNRVAANFKSRGDRLSACGEAARGYVLSKLQQIGGTPSSITINETIPDESTASKQSTITTAHYGGPQILSVVPVSPASISSSRKQVRDIANSIPLSPILGGQYQRVVVRCREASGTESEIEFVFRYGV